MSEKGFERLASKGALLLSVAALAAATGCETTSANTPVPTIEPTPTVEPFPSPSPEVVLAIEKSAQETIDPVFEGLGIHSVRLIGNVLIDVSGQNRFALFETQLPHKDRQEDLSFLMIAGVGEENKIEWVRGLVASEAYPQEGDTLTFSSATFDAETQTFEIQDPYLRTNTQTGEIEIATNGITWIPLLGDAYTFNEFRAKVGGGVLAAVALPTPESSPTTIASPTPEAGLTDEEINNLAAQLTCGNACIYEASFGVEGHSFGLEFISTGRFKTIEVTDPATGNIVGHIDAFIGITRDSTGKPLVILYAAQATTVENPNLNLLRAILTQDAVDAGIHEKFETLEDVIATPQSIDFLQTLYSSGRTFRRIVPTDLSQSRDSWAISIQQPIFSNPDYAQMIKEFAKKGGVLENYEEPILIFPA